MHECNCKVAPTVSKTFLSDRRLAASQGFSISFFYGRSYLQNCFYGSKNIQCEQPKEPWADIYCRYIKSISESFSCVSLAQFQFFNKFLSFLTQFFSWVDRLALVWCLWYMIGSSSEWIYSHSGAGDLATWIRENRYSKHIFMSAFTVFIFHHQIWTFTVSFFSLLNQDVSFF